MKNKKAECVLCCRLETEGNKYPEPLCSFHLDMAGKEAAYTAPEAFIRFLANNGRERNNVVQFNN